MDQLSSEQARITTNWAQYQREIYGALRPPQFSTDPQVWEQQAAKKLAGNKFWYIAGSANQGLTDRANREAFARYRLIPRMLAGASSPRDLSIELFGKKFPSPLLAAPIGVQSIAHASGELGSAVAVARLNIPFVLSTASNTNLEDIADAHERASVDSAAVSTSSLNGFAKPERWFQLYWPKDDEVTISLLKRAQESGFTTLVITLDTFTLGFRPADLDRAYLPFVWGEGCAIGFNDPVFNSIYVKFQASGPQLSLPDKFKLLLQRSRGNIGLFVWILCNHRKVFKSLAWISQAFSGINRTWQDLELIKNHWHGPIVLKGIQSVQDARLAVEHGIDGIVVSNHGGRQVDGAVASLNALANITADDTVKQSNMTILFDSGIRTGSDVVKALALGANAVLIGRPYMYGLALGGEQGVQHVFKSLLAEVDITMGNIGKSNIAELTRDILDIEKSNNA
ncbi:FMN-dependent dehydrogenase [Lipomyces japonicus]|uniref:FMN-dependent dehydrogenase n=1 Tax=Lipomyces japonicus TaxID=56871 RepID=UPI0034CFCEBF